MKIYSAVPIYQLKKNAMLSNTRKKKRVVIKTEFLNAEGDEFIPFDGMSFNEMTGYVDVDTDEVWFSANGEDFYDAEGKKVRGEGLKNLLKKIGKGIGKGAKAIGKGVVKGIKAIGRFVKKIAGKVKGRSSKKEQDTKEAPKGTVPKGLPLLAIGMSMPMTATGQKFIKEGSTAFVKPLPPATATTTPQNTVEVDGKKYSAENVGKDEKIAVSTNPVTGQTIVGAEIPVSKVTAVVGADGKYDYYQDKDVETKGSMTKWLLIGGGVLVLGGLIYFIAKKK